ncbi:NAD(P)-binding protein [Ramicandelaber brevisporus]|nr:NAD(P)-binding protein [Ramicandelaber brevisporus]
MFDFLGRIYRINFPRTVLPTQDPSAARPLRIGVLGAAAIAPNAIIKPARLLPDSVAVTAVAARDTQKAAAFAKKHGIARVLASYDELIADADIDAVYIPLPNSLHLQYALRAIAHGKHVLCEKPVAANADEAQQILAASGRAPLQCYEAFHWRCHPAARRFREIVRSSAVGDVQSIHVNVTVPSYWFDKKTDIRFKHALAGGAMMDLGCYAVSAIRLVLDDADVPITVTSATPTIQPALNEPQIDTAMRFELDIDNRGRKITATADLSFNGSVLQVLAPLLRVTGTNGTATFDNFMAPFFTHEIIVDDSATGRRTTETQYGENSDSTYYHQLVEFASAVKSGTPSTVLPDAIDAVKNMRVVDSVYLKAGLSRRG